MVIDFRFLSFFAIFSVLSPFCPFLSCPFLPFTGEGGQKGTWDPPYGSDNLNVSCKVIDKLIHHIRDPYSVKLMTEIPQKISSGSMNFSLRVLHLGQLFGWVLRPQTLAPQWRPRPISRQKYNIYQNTKFEKHKNIFSPIGQKMAELWPKNVCPYMELLIFWGLFWPITWPNINFFQWDLVYSISTT